MRSAAPVLGWTREAEPYVGRLVRRLTNALEQARAARQQYAALLEQATEAIAVLTDDGVIREVSRRWEEMLDLPRAVMIGRRLSELDIPARIDVTARFVTLDGDDVILAIGRRVAQKRGARPRLSRGGPVDDAPAPPPAAPRRETVLLVEDDDQLRVVVRQILVHEGYSVLDARDGHQALALASEHDGGIQLVLSEMEIPGPGGAEIARCIQGRCGPTTALLMTSAADPPGSDAMRRAGVRMIPKPFSAADIASRVRDALDATP